jgi:hypothetical protein
MLARGSTIGSVLGGLVAATDLQVTYQGSGLKIEVAQGEAIIPGNVSATQSGYYFRNTAAATITLAAANGSNPRIERIVAVVFDESYEGAKNEAKIEVKEGTAKAGATLTNLEGVAAAPKNSITLAYVLVPAAATTISNADIKNVAQGVTGALWPLAVTPSFSSVTAKSGQLIEMLGSSGNTATLPAPYPNAIVGVSSPLVESKVKTNGGVIIGDGLATNEISLAIGQHLLLLGEGSNWLIIGGTAAISVSQHATTPTFVSWGSIGTAGEILAGSGDYTVSKTGQAFTVTWKTPKSSANYAVMVSPHEAAEGSGTGVEVSKEAEDFIVNFWRGSTHVGLPWDFVVAALS